MSNVDHPEVHRFTHQSANAPTAPTVNPPASVAHDGAYRYTAGQEHAEADQGGRHIVSRSGTPGGSVAATLMRQGSAMTVELVPGDPSSRTLAATAERQGLITRGIDGRWVDAQQAHEGQPGNAQQEAQQDEQEAPEQSSAFVADEDAAYAQLIAPLPQPAYDAAQAAVIATIAGREGVDLEKAAAHLVRAGGIEPGEAQAQVEAAVAHYERVVARDLAALGISGERLEQAYDHFRGRPDQLQDALQRLVHFRDASGFRALAVEFKRSNSGDLSAYHAAGFETHVDQSSGDLMIKRLGGNWVYAKDLGKTSAQRTSRAPSVTPTQAPTGTNRTGRMVVDPVSGDMIDEGWL